MLFRRETVKSLLNTSELHLFDDATRDAIKDLDRTAVNARLARARQLRDRYRTLAPRDPALRQRKAAVFDELTTRFQRRLEHIARLEERRLEAADRSIGSE